MRVFLISIFILFFIESVWGEDFSLISKVDKNKIGLGEEFEFTVEIEGDFRITPKIELPDLKDFEIVFRQSFYNFNIKGGKFLSKVKFIFTLEPKSEGKFLIGEVKVRYREREYKTEPIEIIVLPGIKKELPKEPERRYPREIPRVTL